MIRAIYDISEQIVKKKKKVTAKYLDACNLLFERGILSHSTITSNDSQVLKNMQRGLNYFMDWHEEMTENGKWMNKLVLYTNVIIILIMHVHRSQL